MDENEKLRLECIKLARTIWPKEWPELVLRDAERLFDWIRNGRKALSRRASSEASDLHNAQ
jgi:hypothetical protein